MTVDLWQKKVMCYYSGCRYDSDLVIQWACEYLSEVVNMFIWNDVLIQYIEYNTITNISIWEWNSAAPGRCFLRVSTRRDIEAADGVGGRGRDIRVGRASRRHRQHVPWAAVWMLCLQERGAGVWARRCTHVAFVRSFVHVHALPFFLDGLTQQVTDPVHSTLHHPPFPTRHPFSLCLTTESSRSDEAGERPNNCVACIFSRKTHLWFKCNDFTSSWEFV